MWSQLEKKPQIIGECAVFFFMAHFKATFSFWLNGPTKYTWYTVFFGMPRGCFLRSLLSLQCAECSFIIEARSSRF